MKLKKAKKCLYNTLLELDRYKWLFSNSPTKDFSRNRKLSFIQIVKALLCMGGGSLSDEMIHFFGITQNSASTSAFIQQRKKIFPAAFETLFHLFSENIESNKKYKHFRLLAVDGSDFRTASDPNDPDSFFPGVAGQKSYNLLHLNALFDIVQHIYVDALVQKRCIADERGALVTMADRSNIPNALLLADRGYESYNVFSHIQEKGWKFLFRIKDGTTGIVSGLDLPEADSFDVPFSLKLTNKQSNETKELFKDKNHYKFMSDSRGFDFLPNKIDKSSPAVWYTLNFRIVRFPITASSFETVITNLDADLFPPDELKRLYAMRWGIETSFRELKYTVGLQAFHAKKVEFILQEIFARLTMYNFYEVITQSVVIQQKKNRKYDYKVNFSHAVQVCKQFFLLNLAPPLVEAELKRHISPIRRGRSNPREFKSTRNFGFIYRIA